ncbi:MAG TPA: hypothetical protein VFX58_15385, partial [Chitinophagaceae bacterium]|nr:hypothetical protein [Chitinophagaceae bacterium]
MEKLVITARNRENLDDPESKSITGFTYRSWQVILFTVLFVLLITGCTKQDSTGSFGEGATASTARAATFPNRQENISAQTIWELQQARAATARYQDIKNAFKDEYEDLNLPLPNMGHHFMKRGLVDAEFDIRKPELLVYNKMEDGEFELVAVEYAVPIPMAPADGPAGFTGD